MRAASSHSPDPGEHLVQPRLRCLACWGVPTASVSQEYKHVMSHSNLCSEVSPVSVHLLGHVAMLQPMSRAAGTCLCLHCTWQSSRHILCRVQDVFLLPEHVAIVMEMASGGDLAEYMAEYVAKGVRACSQSKKPRAMLPDCHACLYLARPDATAAQQCLTGRSLLCMSGQMADISCLHGSQDAADLAVVYGIAGPRTAGGRGTPPDAAAAGCPAVYAQQGHRQPRHQGACSCRF